MQASAAGKRLFSFLHILATGIVSATLQTDLQAANPVPATRLESLAVPFVPNAGQADRRVAFYAKTFAGTVFVTTEGKLVYSLAGGRRPARADAAPVGWTLAETYTAAPAAPTGLRQAVTRVSEFSGARLAQGSSDLPTYEGIALGEVAPGVELELRAAGRNVEKLFRVAPGADASRIRVRLDGAERLAIGPGGSLIAGTGLGDVEFTAPLAYQERDGQRTEIPVRYVLDTADRYSFAVGAYDPSLPLTIDPLIRSTFSGGTASDVIRAMLVHPGSGEVYVAGSTTSTGFPGTSAGAQTTNAGTTDAFVARYNAGLTSLLRATYYGGTGLDIANAIAILPSSGDIYIAGTTTSATGLPNITGSFGGGDTDAFVVRFDGALSVVMGARYFGGSGSDSASSLAVDTLKNEIIVAGDTTSQDLALGTGAQQTTNGGGQDGFVARFSANLAGLVRATYFGGSGSDRVLAAAFDPLTGDVIVAGVTDSAVLPGTANSALPDIGGLTDGFVARLSGDLMVLRQSSYFGGNGNDQINAVAIHPLNGHVYVAGDTASPALRGKPTGQLVTGGGPRDAFVARFYPDLSGLLAVSFFGGGGDESGTSLAISKYSGEVYLAGYSASATLTGTGSGIQESNAGGNDAFVARFDAALSGIKQSTFLGGSDSDIANAVAVNDLMVYIAGETGSTTFPGVSQSSAQPAIGGGTDGFISAMGTDLSLGNTNPAAFSFGAVINALPATVQTSAPAKVTPTGDALAYVDGQPGSTWCASSTASCATCDKTPGNTFTSSPAKLTTTAPNPYYVCVRHTSSAAPNVITESTMHIGTVAATFRVGTGAIPGFGCTLDVDGNGTQDALTDGLLILRALFGLTGTTVTNGAVGNNAIRLGWSDISAYFNTNCGASFSP